MHRIKQKGISPVIGVILLVSVTVALVALTTIIVFDIGGDVNESSSSTVQTSTGSYGVQVQVTRNENVEEFEVVGPNDRTDTMSGDVGDSLNIGDGAGQYIVKAILSDNNEEVIDTINVEEGSSASEVRTGTEEDTGTVTVNPDIEGAIVQSIEDGFIIDETMTNENGEYTIEYSEDSEIFVNIEGFEHDNLDNPLYAGEIRQISNKENLDFNFDEEKFTTATVNDEISYISQGENNEKSEKIYNVGQLQAMNENLDEDYKLVTDIDASDTENWEQSLFNQTVRVRDIDDDILKTNYAPIDEVFSVTSDGEELNYEINDSDEGIIEIKDDDYNDVSIEYSTTEPINVGFKPIGDNDYFDNDRVEKQFKGNFDGNDHEINNLYINRPDENYVGLIGDWYDNDDANIKNVSITNVNIKGSEYVGGLIGVNYNEGDLSDITVKGYISGDRKVGGLIGETFNQGDDKEILNISSYSDIESTNGRAGGIVGQSTTDISDSYAKGNVVSEEDGSIIGGLVGQNEGQITKSYSTGNIQGDGNIGGLVGTNSGGGVSDSYALGDITGDNHVGGLVGQNTEGIIEKSYAKNDVEGDENVGGLVGWNNGLNNEVRVFESYSIGNVIGNSATHGLVGQSSVDSEISDSYWDKSFTIEQDGFDTSSEELSGAVPLETNEIKGDKSYKFLEGFDFEDTWHITNDNYVILQQNKENENDEIIPINEVPGKEDNPIEITNIEELQEINKNVDSHYELANDIDASETSEWNDGKGFKPIAGAGWEYEFTGSLDGQGYEIQDLTIDRPDEENIGLIGYLGDGKVKNINVNNVDIIGSWAVGGLVGYNVGGTVSDSYATGSVTSRDDAVGGLVGANDFESEVRNSYATSDVTSEDYDTVGGLIGWNGGEVSESYATGSVIGATWVGGLIGENFGEVSKSYATGSVTGDNRVGGLVGDNTDKVSKSYATGSVTGDSKVGGLIGRLGRDSSFSDEDHILRDSYVLEDEELTDENKVIGKIVEGDGDGNVSITHGETDITTAEDEETFEDISITDLNNEFVKTKSGFQDESELEEFDFDETWLITDTFPELQWQE